LKDILLNIEAVIFASAEGINLHDLRLVLQEALAIEITKEELDEFVGKIKQKYASEDQVFELHMINEQYQFLTKAVYHPAINQLQLHKEKRKLSQAGLECLSSANYKIRGRTDTWCQL